MANKVLTFEELFKDDSLLEINSTYSLVYEKKKYFNLGNFFKKIYDYKPRGNFSELYRTDGKTIVFRTETINNNAKKIHNNYVYLYSITNNKNESINVLGIDHKLVRVKKGTLYDYEEEIDDDASWRVPKKNFYINSTYEDFKTGVSMINTNAMMHIENSIIKMPNEKTKISVDNKITFVKLYNDKDSIGKETIYSLPYKKKHCSGDHSIILR